MSYYNKRIVFAGGTDWSVEFLETLVREGFNVVGVLAPPDSRKNRGQKAAPPVLKVQAGRLNIPILQPEKLSDEKFLTDFRGFKPDVVVVIAYGKIFPKEVLNIPELGFVNFHPSLLPELRGPSPIPSALLEGLEETGVSIIKLGEGMDDGPLLAQKSIKITSRETNETLTRKLINLGKKMLPEILKHYLDYARTNNIKSLLKAQEHKNATYCKIISKEDGQIDWQKESAEIIDRKVRAFNPQFKTFTFLKKNDKKLRINILATTGIKKDVLSPGEFTLEGRNIAVGTKKDCLLISRLQIEGKKPLSAEEFVRGYGAGNFSI